VSVHFISGKPGGGKTLYSLKLIIEELVYGSRPIFTNIPIHAGRLSEYLQEKFPNKQIDLLTRLVLLDDDTQTPRFWTVRPGCPTIPVLTPGEWSQGKKPVYENIQDSGVFYAIDEIHNFFNARAWQETGRDVLFYLSQHRKLGDTVVCITQAIGNVDKQFRSVTQDFTYLRNLNKERMGLFRLPAVFVRRTFGSPATDTSQPMETGTFTLDVSGIASCYNTAQGVSIHGKVADLKEKKTGLSIWWFVIGLPAILMAIVFGVPRLGASLFDRTKDVKAIVAKKVEPTNSVPAVAPEPKSYHVATNQSVKQQTNETGNHTNSQPVEVKVTAVERVTGPWRVFLSNGESYRAGEGLEEITGNRVIIMGRVYRYANVPCGPPLPPSNPVSVSLPSAPPPMVRPTVEVTYFGKRDTAESRQLPVRPPVQQWSQVEQNQ